MMKRLEGKVALITGGASGIGKAVAEEFLKRKIKISILDVNENVLNETLKKFQSSFGKNEIIGLLCDVTDNERFEKRIEETKSVFGRLDILINNAGILLEDQPKKTVDVNLNGVITGTMLAFRHLSNEKGERSGMVINTASIAGFAKFSTYPCYRATKHAVLAFSQCWGDEENVKTYKVKVNAICPDMTDTPILFSIKSDEKFKELNERVYGGKVLQPEEIAQGFIKLLEDDVTGEALVISIRKGIYYLPRTNSLDY